MSDIKRIKEIEDKRDWLGHMIRFKPQMGLSALKWVETFTHYLINMPVQWSLITDTGLQIEWSEHYQKRYGQWNHAGGPHNDLGMAYAWAIKNLGEDIILSDSPDFWFTLEGRNIVGDIGACSPGAVIEGLRNCIHMHSLWVSVLDYDTQMVLEFNYNPSAYIESCLAFRLLGSDFDRKRAIEDTFWCSDCQKWTITKKSRDQFWRPRKEKNPEKATPPNRQLSLF